MEGLRELLPPALLSPRRFAADAEAGEAALKQVLSEVLEKDKQPKREAQVYTQQQQQQQQQQEVHAAML